MFKLAILICALALATALPAPAAAQSSKELEEIRKQIEALKDAYETRIQALEKRLKAAEDSSAAAATATAAQAQGAQQAAAPTPAEPPPTAPTASQSAFNPALSLILDGRYVNSSQDPARRTMTGFLSNADTSDALGSRGFSLGETELTMSANVDQLFYGQATLAVEPDDSIGVEEAFGQTTALGHGPPSRAGAFSRASATATPCMLMPGTSPTHRLCSAPSWATTTPTTACSSPGLRRCRFTSRWAVSSAAACIVPAAIATRTAQALPLYLLTWAMTSAPAAAIGWAFRPCGLPPTATALRLSTSTIAPAPPTRFWATHASTVWTSSTSGRPTATRSTATSS